MISKIFSAFVKLIPYKLSILNWIKNNPDITEQGIKEIIFGRKKLIKAKEIINIGNKV